jgi:outer membrane protein insertion porin family
MVLGLGVAVPAWPQLEFPAELKTVEHVRFEGGGHVPRKELKAVMKTRNPSIWPWRKHELMRVDFVRADTAAVEQVCRQHGFLDAVVRARLEPGHRKDGVVVTFRIEEGPRYKIESVRLTGLASVPEAPVRRHLFARPGRSFNPYYLYADTSSIAAQCREHGYLPRVDALAERHGHAVSIEYFVDEGRRYMFGDVHFSSPGATHVKPRLVLREITFKSGETFKGSEVQESIAQIYRTGMFNQVQMASLPDSSNGVVEFDLRVHERPPRWFDAGVGSGTAERFRFTGEWGHRNLNARGLQAIASSKLALDGQTRFLLARGEATLYDPWLLRQRRRGSATVYIERVHDRANSDFLVKRDSRGVTFQVRRDYRRFTHLVVTQDNAYVQQQFDSTGTGFSTHKDSLGQVPLSYSTHRLQLGLERDTRDDLINPFRGTDASFTAEIAGGPLQGTSSFTRLTGTASWYLTLGATSVLAVRVRAGAIDPFGKLHVFTPDTTLDSRVQRVPLEDRYRLGGVNSIRGYAENVVPELGGLAMLLGNAELRLPLAGPFGAEVFVDAGNVWARPSFIHLRDFGLRMSDAYYGDGDVRYVAGAGLRLNLPFGPLRFDVSWSSQRDRGNRPVDVAPTADNKDLRDRRPVPQIAIGTTF